MSSPTEFPELSCYLLPGHTTTPADAIREAQQAEALGQGNLWLSERFDVIVPVHELKGWDMGAGLAINDWLQSRR